MPFFSRLRDAARRYLLAPVVTGIAQQVATRLTEQQQVRYVHRLSPSVYADFEKQFTKPGLPSANPQEFALYQMGVESVLRKLRDGYLDVNAHVSN